jgi:two-component system NtrC family sensor kinase
MKGRIASIAFLFSSISIALAWLTLQPMVIRMIAAIRKLAPSGAPQAELLVHFRTFLPLYFILNLLLLTATLYLVLYVMVGRPLHRAEEVIEQIGRFELEMPFEASGGPLLARIQAALRRMAQALVREQALTRRQLAELATANERLRKAQMELVSTERLATVGKLAAGVAHEVGNPLAGILGYLCLAKTRSTGSPELLGWLGAIEAELHRIDRIVRGLLDLGRSPRGASGPVDVTAIIDTCTKLVSAGSDFKNVEVDLQLEPAAFARGESGALSQVIINLLINAAQAVEGNGKVVVRSRRENDQVVVQVEDSGAGIPEMVLARLFEPFVSTKGGKGSGLGLAISRHLVSSMGGQLLGANVPGGGARFTVSLPAA